MFFYMFLSIHFGHGPLWPRYEALVSNTCGKYWWTNVLYINNFVPHEYENQCMLWGWYLAVDFQLYIFAPIIFLLYNKSRALGWGLVVALIAASTIGNFVVAHAHNLVWDDLVSMDYFTLIYSKPYFRASPYLMGIACAFLYLEKRQISRTVAYVMFLAGSVILALLVYGPITEYTGTKALSLPLQNHWGRGTQLVMLTVGKLAWSSAISMLFYGMAQGHFSVLRRFLGAHFWTPLARLTYSTYLFHPIIMFIVWFSHKQSVAFDPFSYSVMYIGFMFVGFSTAAVMFLALERPMVNMEKLFLPQKKH